MPDWLSVHQPVLINTIGHSVAAVVFATLLGLLAWGWRRGGEARSALPMAAAGLALIWNLSSLAALAAGPAPSRFPRVMMAIGFSALSLLPALLLPIALEGGARPSRWQRAAVAAGGGLSAAAVGFHWADLATGDARFHSAGLWTVTLGFALLTLPLAAAGMRGRNPMAGRRLAGSMALLLLVISYLHFGAAQGRLPWAQEVALHHAGLPLALLVLLQDYRFLLLDAFLRVTMAAALAGGSLWAALSAIRALHLLDYARQPFAAGLLLVGGGLALVGFVWLHGRLQRFLTRVVFLRAHPDEALRGLHDLRRAADTDADYLRCAVEVLARSVHAARCELRASAPEHPAPAAPCLMMDPAAARGPAWAQVAVPLRFGRGDAATLYLGRRDGGRRYLNDELQALGRLAAAVAGHIGQLRALQLERLVAQAELKALQAQITPHFLFNTLNTLYGSIARENAEARRMVLRLAEIFRYLLRSDRTLVEVKEELDIVRAYLDIERLRLGEKLRTEWEVAPEALPVRVPLLAIQTLVENAVNHGVAARVGPGFVRLTIRHADDRTEVEVVDSGDGGPPRPFGDGGVGLNNLRRRLRLSFGPTAAVRTGTRDGLTFVSFQFRALEEPARPPAAPLGAVGWP